MEKKRFKRFLASAIFCAGSMLALCLGNPAMAAETTDSSEAAPTVTPTPAAETQNGWVTTKKGQKRYYKNGKYLTRLQKLDGKYYYFNPKNGYMKKSTWMTIKKKKYYFNSKGVGSTGLTKIKKKWYYFTRNATLKTKTTKTGKTTYYMNKSGNVEAYKKGGKYYYPSGKKMSSTKAANYETLQYAKKMLAKITTSGMSKRQKLSACFKWVIKHGYHTTHIYMKQKNWQTLFANDYLKDGRNSGSCFSDSCAFAFLAKAIGYKNVKICVDTTGTANAHCFAMIDGLCYDPLFAETKGYSSNYAARLGVYTLYPMYTVSI